MWPSRGRVRDAPDNATIDQGLDGRARDLHARLQIAAHNARRLRRKTRAIIGGLTSITLLVPAVLYFGVDPSFPTDFRAGMPRLPPALGVVATSLDEADAIAVTFRRAGLPVESWSPASFSAEVKPDGHTPGAWWISRGAAEVIKVSDVERVLAEGGRVLLDGDTALSRSLLQLRKARGIADTTREAVMRGVDLHWDVDVKTLQPHVPGTMVAATAVGTPALFVAREGALWWSAPSISDGPGPLRLPFLAQELAAHWGIRPRASRPGVDVFVDLDTERGVSIRELVARWSAAGAKRVFVPAWKQNDDMPWRFDYRPLLKAAHARGIEVWAWVEWPHVDFSFWRRNPDCRERTATGNEAKVNWKELVAVEVPDCFERAWQRTRAVLRAVKFDGVNVSGLAFESPYFGHQAPEYYTPFHPLVRKDFHQRYGWDPIEIVRDGPRNATRDRASLAKWERYRKDLLIQVYDRLLTRIAALPSGQRLAVTLMDDRENPVQGALLRDNSAASNSEIIALASRHHFEVILRDPVPFRPIDVERIHAAYEGLLTVTPALGVSAVRRPERGTAITDAPVGLELASAVRDAASSGATVVLFASGPLRADDLAWTPHAYAAAAVKVNEVDGVVHTDSAVPFQLFLAGRARRIRIDGRTAGHGDSVPVPSGKHQVTAE